MTGFDTVFIGGAVPAFTPSPVPGVSMTLQVTTVTRVTSVTNVRCDGALRHVQYKRAQEATLANRPANMKTSVVTMVLSAAD
jgi:hypothetical protein